VCVCLRKKDYLAMVNYKREKYCLILYCDECQVSERPREILEGETSFKKEGESKRFIKLSLYILFCVSEPIM